ncbi:CPK2 [Symbiodinium necroappetens]|uniref:non-specific serine/threonine protein kinase n=1 Tax=Symbiodinium necroappetens TaxID=1628268 RepID=A0A813AK59_9DINO|nr:CPK2 [Symbiodinium necroappetens]
MCRCLLCRSAPEATLITPQTAHWLLPFRRCFGASFRSESLPKAAGKWLTMEQWGTRATLTVFLLSFCHRPAGRQVGIQQVCRCGTRQVKEANIQPPLLPSHAGRQGNRENCVTSVQAIVEKCNKEGTKYTDPRFDICADPAKALYVDAHQPGSMAVHRGAFWLTGLKATSRWIAFDLGHRASLIHQCMQSDAKPMFGCREAIGLLMGVNCSCAAEDLELKQKDLKENADTVKQDNDEAIREIHFANAQPILNDTRAEAFADEDDKRNSDKAVKKEEDDEPKSTTSKESAWNRRDFFLQSSANVLTNALCAVIENPGDFEAFYTVKEKVGAGQFGTVSAAVITANGAERAVKTVEKKAQRSFLTALRAEMEIMKVLDHPNLITICEIFENSETIILAMKLCKGPHLTQYVERVASLSEKQASFVMRDLLRAVAYMHNSQVCHRDLKGENCLMLNQGPPERNRLKICDFGLSCKFEPGGFLSGRMGSVSHIGPEVLKSPDKYTHACDCWSCGIIFYHLICGFLPFHEEKEVLNNRLSFSDRHFCHLRAIQ